MHVTSDGDRKMLIRFTRGDQIKEFPVSFPVMRYRGIYRDSVVYEEGDTCTRSGSLWYALKQTTERPGDQAKNWVLTAKRGADGKDGPQGRPGADGAPGRPGRDLTQLGPDGAKW